jgi:hypothetical protein
MWQILIPIGGVWLIEILCLWKLQLGNETTMMWKRFTDGVQTFLVERTLNRAKIPSVGTILTAAAIVSHDLST